MKFPPKSSVSHDYQLVFYPEFNDEVGFQFQIPWFGGLDLTTGFNELLRSEVHLDCHNDDHVITQSTLRSTSSVHIMVCFIPNFTFFLLQEEMEERPRISTLISSLANYSNTIPAAESADPDAKPQPSGGAAMGTLVGVYLPCIQNIFGVILFIRLTWVVGTAGAIQGFLIVLCCCCVVICLYYVTKVNHVP